MNFKSIFEQIDGSAKEKVNNELKSLVKGDGAFLKMKKLAKKSSDNVPDFLDYVYNTYRKQIDKLSSKYKIDYDELAQMIIAL